MTKAHLTAMARNKPSKPMEWLASNDRIGWPALDFGCGKGYDADEYNMDKYDPHYSPAMPSGLFETITCNYVLNVIESDTERLKVLRDIRKKLTPDGKAYITVRADRNALKGRTSRGTYQCEVVLRLPVVRKESGYVMYMLTREDTLDSTVMTVRVN